MNSTLGAPSRARTGAGHAGADSSVVRPITPGNAAPGPYSTIAIRTSPFARRQPVSCGVTAQPASPGTDGFCSCRISSGRMTPDEREVAGCELFGATEPPGDRGPAL